MKLTTLLFEGKAFIPASIVLQRLHDEAPADYFTLGWLMGSLRRRSFGILMLLLALVARAPGVAIIAGLLLMIPAFQMMSSMRPAPCVQTRCDRVRIRIVSVVASR